MVGPRFLVDNVNGFGVGASSIGFDCAAHHRPAARVAAEIFLQSGVVGMEEPCLRSLALAFDDRSVWALFCPGSETVYRGSR